MFLSIDHISHLQLNQPQQKGRLLHLLLLRHYHDLIPITRHFTTNLRNNVLIQRSSERLLKDLAMGLEHFFDARLFWIREDSVLHLYVIGRYQLRLLPQLLYSVDNLTGNALSC